MKAIIEAMEFKRLIDNTKRFTSKNSTNKLMQYIYLEVNAETKEVKASAVDGHRISIEYTKAAKITEPFACYVKPVIPKITKRDKCVELELVDNKAYITVNDNIMGYKQPEGEFFKTEKFVSDYCTKPVEASIYVDAKLLQEAIASTANSAIWKNAVKIEIRGRKDPVIIRSKGGNVKAVLPVRVEGEEENGYMQRM